MNMLKRILSIVVGVLVLAALPAYSQQYPPFPGIGDDGTSSLGSFKIQVATQFASLFTSCSGYDPPSRVFTSPTLYDPGTVIGRSNVTLDDSPFRKGSVPAGSRRVVVPEDTLIQPPGFPCFGITGCASGAGTRVVHTEIHSLNMTAAPPPTPSITVRAGVYYDDTPYQTDPPFRHSVGLVASQSGPSNNPSLDFPASSFFDVYAKVDIPSSTCSALPPGLTITLYNSMPLIVTNSQLTQFPPKVVYLHDASTIVPILFEYDGPMGAGGPLWHKNDKLGCFVLAGHGVGFTNSQTDTTNFNNYMGGQSNSPCPL